MFSDYTVKKAVPKLLIAVILVNLSWVICQAAITTTNIIGDGVADLITTVAIPGATSSDFPTFSNMSNGAAVFTWTALIGGAGAAGVALFTGGVFAALGAIIAAIAALLLGFIVLMFRQFFIAVLVMISPLALVCWAIPGMEKWAKRWWDFFFKLLLMFPFVMAMFGVSDVLAIVLKDGADNFISQLMLVFVRFAPFALMPLVFKVAGGAFSTITGMVNDRGKGVFDRGKNWSKERAGTTKRANAKNERKNLSLAERQRKGSDLIIKKPRTAWDSIQNRATGGRLGQGVGEADIEVLKAKQEQEKIRAASAREAQYSAQNKAGMLRMDESYVDDPNTVFNGGLLNKREALAEIAAGNEVHVKRGDGKEILLGGSSVAAENDAKGAAMKLSSQGDIKGLRQAIHSIENDASTSSQVKAQRRQTLTDAMQSNVGQVMPKAPDLIKPAGAAFGSISAEEMLSWDDSTATVAVQHLSSMSPGGERDAAWSRFESSLDTVLNDPKRYGVQKGAVRAALATELSSQAAAPGATGDIISAANRATTASPGSGKGRLKPDGTVEIMP